MYKIYDFNTKNLNKITHKKYFQISINKKSKNPNSIKLKIKQISSNIWIQKSQQSYKNDRRCM